ncbi:TRAP transporter substrate-binding protein [Clostridiaceae bacterium]|nr:TRAP transporter substrate-binding protein [Clostridiaceae bacterium]
MKGVYRALSLSLGAGLVALALTGCQGASDGRRIVRIGHNQATDHPTHVALLEFEKYVESKLGDQYNVEVYPSELLGSQTDMVQLTQTGAIDFCVASNSILETFSDNYTLFNMPYLFASAEAYHASMDDADITGPIFDSTKKAGFEAVTWIDAGTRNFYTVSTPIHSPADLKGLKIRVQQSPTNVEMMRLLGGSATPMGFGEVYTALQSKIIDGAENNEMALTSNGHGDVCKYYSYDMHQMIPDILIGNCAFLDGLSPEDRAVFEEGFQIVNQVERQEWTKAVEAAKSKAEHDQGVQFLYPDTAPFQEICIPMHQSVLGQYPDLKPFYDAIQVHNKEFTSENTEGGAGQ